MENNEDVIVELEMEDGSTVNCSLVAVFESQGREYAALAPVGGPNEQIPDFVFYRYSEIKPEGEEEGEASLEWIEDDEEYEKAGDDFEKIVASWDE